MSMGARPKIRIGVLVEKSFLDFPRQLSPHYVEMALAPPKNVKISYFRTLLFSDGDPYTMSYH